MTYDGSPALPTGPVFQYTLQPQPAGYTSMTFGTPVYPTHEMYPAGFKDKVAALADAYEGLVEATGEACDDFAGTAEREAEQAARMRVQELRAELGLS